jgi:hypothetical protein
MNTIHALTPYFLKILFNIILLLKLTYPRRSLPFRFSHQNFVCISCLCHACYMSQKLLTMQFSPSSYYYLSLVSKFLSTLFLHTCYVCSSLRLRDHANIKWKYTHNHLQNSLRKKLCRWQYTSCTYRIMTCKQYCGMIMHGDHNLLWSYSYCGLGWNCCGRCTEIIMPLSLLGLIHPLGPY